MTALHRKPFVALLLALGVAVLLGTLWMNERASLPAETLETTATLWPDPRPLPDFTLQDHEGRDFGPVSMRGHWSWVFFGFTHCNEICPTTLARLALARGQLQSDPGLHGITRTVLVTLDPERDDPAALADYVRRFDATFVGVSGKPGAVDALARWFGVAHETHAGSDQIDHSGHIFLVDPEGRLRGVYTGDPGPEALAEDLRLLARFRVIEP